MKNCYHDDYFKSYLPAEQGILICFTFFRVGKHALEILDTMNGHFV